MAWTDEQRQKVIELWSAGKSARYIAAELGSTITRNAVIGLVYRMGIKSPRPNPHASVRPHAIRRTGARSTRQNRWRRRTPQARRLVQEPPPIQPEPISLAAARAGDCRWPLDDPLDVEGFHFCGASVWPGSSYCPGHHALAHRPQGRPAEGGKTAFAPARQPFGAGRPSTQLTRWGFRR